MDSVLVFTAVSMVERDSLMAFLKSEGVDSDSPKRDISRKYTESTVDLSYGGYSAVFDGFKVLVDEKDKKKAVKLINEFKEKIQVKNMEPSPRGEKRNLMKFYYFSIAGFFIPILPLFFGVYYLYKGLKEREKIRVLYMICSLFFYGVSIAIGYTILAEAIKKVLTFFIET